MPARKPELTIDSPEVVAGARRSGLSGARCHALGRLLPQAMSLLWRRQASQVPDGHLDAYVALGWLAWNGGTLVLTPSGESVHDIVANEARAGTASSLLPA